MVLYWINQNFVNGTFRLFLTFAITNNTLTNNLMLYPWRYKFRCSAVPKGNCIVSFGTNCKFHTTKFYHSILLQAKHECICYKCEYCLALMNLHKTFSTCYDTYCIFIIYTLIMCVYVLLIHILI